MGTFKTPPTIHNPCNPKQKGDPRTLYFACPFTYSQTVVSVHTLKEFGRI